MTFLTGLKYFNICEMKIVSSMQISKYDHFFRSYELDVNILTFSTLPLSHVSCVSFTQLRGLSVLKFYQEVKGYAILNCDLLT